eukprot:COSAG05_NODE_9354_length_629_cov_1.300000_1_plen_132_part_00
MHVESSKAKGRTAHDLRGDSDAPNTCNLCQRRSLRGRAFCGVQCEHLTRNKAAVVADNQAQIEPATDRSRATDDRCRYNSAANGSAVHTREGSLEGIQHIGADRPALLNAIEHGRCNQHRGGAAIGLTQQK